MVLVDTSVWIDHFTHSEQKLQILLNGYRVACHPFVIGGLACGNLKNRTEVLAYLGNLPKASEASHAEVLYFLEKHKLSGKGIGYVDAALLASAALSRLPVWTRDKRLHALAVRMKLAYRAPKGMQG